MKTTPLLLASLACLTIAGTIRERQNTPSCTPTKALPQATSQNEKPTAEKKDQLCAGFDNDDACKSVAKACSKELKDKNQPQDWSSLIKCVDGRRPGAVNVNPGVNAAATATETSKPAPASTAGGSLKPFKNSASAGDLPVLCGVNAAFTDGFANERRRSENCVGTERFCKEAFYEGTEETFASPEECLASRQPKPAPANTAGGSLKPFKNSASAGDLPVLCGVNAAFTDGFANERRRSENCVGTERFCKEAFYEGTEETFASPEECLASRQPKPAPANTAGGSLKPFKNSVETTKTRLQPDSTKCDNSSSEECVGTIIYCEREHYKEFNESFDSPDDCKSSRGVRPAPPIVRDPIKTRPSDPRIN